MRCVECHSLGLCAADCGYAPWNDDRVRASRLVYLLRQRRWTKSPVPTGDIFFLYSWPSLLITGWDESWDKEVRPSDLERHPTTL